MDAGNTNSGVLGAGGANQTQRFHVELTPGETNIVSLKKLLRDAGEVVSDYSSDENEAEKYIFVKLPRKTRGRALAIRDKVQHNTGRLEHSGSANVQTQKKSKELMDHVGEEEDVQGDTKRKRGKKLLNIAEESSIFSKGNSKSLEFNVRNDSCKGDFLNLQSSSGGVILKKHFKSSSKLFPGNKISFTSSARQQLPSRSSMSKTIEPKGFTNIEQHIKIGRNELHYHNLPYTGHALGTASVHMTGATKSGNRMLEWSILQLKFLVEHSKTPLIDVKGADASVLDIEKLLSPELKEKLEKVAGSTQLNEGKISEELIDRLMGILRNCLNRETLKKILREMILQDLYASKAECSHFKQIKKDLVKMIRLQAPSLNVKVFPASEHTTSTFSVGDLMEDKLYDLYDTFSQGLDEDIGPPVVRRLYAKLAELWPKGTMDKHGIREAICRAWERRMVLNEEMI